MISIIIFEFEFQYTIKTNKIKKYKDYDLNNEEVFMPFCNSYHLDSDFISLFNT